MSQLTLAFVRRRTGKSMAKVGLRTPEHRHDNGGQVQFLSEPAERIRALSAGISGNDRAIEIVGRSPLFVEVLTKLEKVSRYPEPVLITGDSGVGKEQFARTLHLLGSPKGPFVPVSCPQYQEGNLTVSELFGHVKGSFTGAIADRRGAFEQADSGVLFLDEIGDLQPGTQAMLLRTLSTGEFRPLGASSPRTARTRVVSATNRSLNQMIISGGFRYDLFFRLRHFHLAIPSLQERGDDWLLLIDYQLSRLERQYGVAKRFSSAALALLAAYAWPGNVRQLIGLVSTGYAMADGDLIEPQDFESLIEGPHGAGDNVQTLYDSIVHHGRDFWEVVSQPFLNRDLNRAQVRTIIRLGLSHSSGSYRRLLEVFHLAGSDYQKFMDFLRHHDLKP
jgi:DNA-binding NtrC family response regulator